MPLFRYEAKNTNNDMRTGFLEARDRMELSKKLHGQGYFLISAHNEKEKIKDSKIFSSFQGFFGVSTKEKLFFFRNLEVMISAGVSLPKSIRTLVDQTENKKFKKALLQIEEKLLKGFTLSQCFGGFSNIFSPLIVNMIKVGEESGTLEVILENLTEHLEKQYQLKSKIISSLMYPFIIILAMIGIGILMLVVVVPSIAETFEDLGIVLPITTQIVIKLGYFFLNYWYVVLFLFVFTTFFLYRLIKTRTGKNFIDGILLKTPILNEILKKYYTVEIIRTLSILIRSGVPILHSLDIVENVALNNQFKKSLSKAKEEVKRGGSLSESFKKYGNLYTNTTIEMFSIGEETGKTGEILEKLTDFYDDEIARTTQNISTIIEPVLMLIIGAVIGFFAVSMIQPMYSMLGSI